MPPAKNHTWGVAFLGRDEKSWGKDGIGNTPIDPNICPSPGQCPYYRDREHDLDNDKIHLVIASFRDQLCPRTLYNLFTRAKNPHRIFVRVLQQLKPDSDLVDDADCWEMACNTYNNNPGTNKLNNGQPFNCKDFEKNVEMVTIDAGLAKGPCDARSKLSALIEHDYRHAKDGKHRLEPVDVRDYCMQTDSHMDFSTGFDNGLIAMFHRAENDRAVLSTYVADMTQNNQDPKEVPHLCMITFTSTWRNWGTKYIRWALKPKLTNLVWGAGMSFQKCHAELNVPYDPYLDNVFDGEETSRGIRFFSHGYDVYTPDKVLVTHDYVGHQSNPVIHTWGRKNAKKATVADEKRKAKFDNVDWSYMEHLTKLKGTVYPDGVRRINILMGIQDARHPHKDAELERLIVDGRFGLGTARTLDQAYQFAGFSNKDLKMHENRCGNLKWVPFEDRDEFNEKNDWGVASNLQRRIWNETSPLLPAPPSSSSSGGGSLPASSLSRGLVSNSDGGGGGGPVASSHPYSHGSTYHTMGWVLMLVLVLGGFLHRSGVLRPKKHAKQLL